MAESIIAPDWKPTRKAPPGYYQSPMYPEMFFKKRDFGTVLSDISVRLSTQKAIAQEVIDDAFASSGKRLSSEDAHRYGVAASTAKFDDYFAWRSSVGLVWWEALEGSAAPANDNARAGKKVAA